jgi:hypothetical protein
MLQWLASGIHQRSGVDSFEAYKEQEHIYVFLKLAVVQHLGTWVKFQAFRLFQSQEAEHFD